jgi:hypothetical protein
MRISPKSDLACLAEGTRFLARRPWTTLGLGLLGMALSALAPLIQMQSRLPDEPMVSSAVIFAAVFPLELYFIPRFLMETDAMAGGNPQNAAGEWKVHFEQRWLKAFLAKTLLAVGAGLGFVLILPGLVVLLAFGWVPLRVLLKGEPLLEAAKGSLRIMAVAWRRMVFTTLALGLVYLTLGMTVAMLVGFVVPEPTLRQRMLHPALWAGNFVASILSLWLSACFLAFFRRLDQAPAASLIP